jgi:Ribbon-helix-helix protein, copG family
MRSVRLDHDMDLRVRRAAELEGVSVSEFLRRAAADRSERTLSASAEDRLADVLGTVHGKRKQARKSGSAFTDALVERRRPRR